MSEQCDTTNIAERYYSFQNDFGSGVIQDYESIIEELFSPEFTKIGNREQLVGSRDELKLHLEKVREEVGGWRIEVINTIKSADNNDYVINYSLKSEKEAWDVIAILGSSDGNKIDSIDGLYYILED